MSHFLENHSPEVCGKCVSEGSVVYISKGVGYTVVRVQQKSVVWCLSMVRGREGGGREGRRGRAGGRWRGGGREGRRDAWRKGRRNGER